MLDNIESEVLAPVVVSPGKKPAEIKSTCVVCGGRTLMSRTHCYRHKKMGLHETGTSSQAEPKPADNSRAQPVKSQLAGTFLDEVPATTESDDSSEDELVFRTSRKTSNALPAEHESADYISKLLALEQKIDQQNTVLLQLAKDQKKIKKRTKVPLSMPQPIIVNTPGALPPNKKQRDDFESRAMAAISERLRNM